MDLTAEQAAPPLATWMRAEGLRDESVAHIAGTGRSTVRRARLGRPLSLRTAEAISQATGGAVSTMQLLRGAAPKTTEGSA